MKRVAVSGAFDDIRSHHIRFLEEASKLGGVTVALWHDDLVATMAGDCRFPLAERTYVLEAIRFVMDVVVSPATTGTGALPEAVKGTVDAWAMLEGEDTPERRAFCDRAGLELAVIPRANLAGFRVPGFDPTAMHPDRRRVIVTGCYDWFHSGHVRFFEECAQLGDLYVAAGNDANVRFLKGEGHPLFPEDERRYIVSACRYVKQALITSGTGWMDAGPEIAVIRPHIYAVNEDGDKPEKRRFCVEHGLEYVVLKRTPAPGLQRRSSTDLRGF